ncbi:DUF6580 family putative transport protein [Telluribacter sp.]|jgi:hypothetical protein|uniref:DUF6580 family putative transport protein n=1 Tax=Telluribacter sp. TaxID=1978767 RepID=UPI002E0D6D58|nr:DUF6580 family putative transport protein [Telluribacter sp.]
MKDTNIRLVTLAVIVLAAALSRLLPHPFNFTPIGAMALFGGAYFGRKYLAFLVPLSAMLISDLLLGFHGSMWAVYGSFILIVLIGMGLLRKITVGRVLAASTLSSILFFLITNFAVWYHAGSMYPQTPAGLLACYVAGLQFYQQELFGNLFLNTVMGDLFFTTLLIGGFEWLKSKAPVLETAKV